MFTNWTIYEILAIPLVIILGVFIVYLGFSIRKGE